MNSPHRPRFVAHLDMLGMSELAERDPEGAWDCLERILKAREEIYRLSMKLVDTGHLISIAYHVELVAFSDSLVAYTNSDTEDDLRSILAFFTELFGRVFYYRIPLRGGLAHGMFAVDRPRSLFSGPALVSAHRLGERAQWLGLVVDDVVESRAAQYNLRAGTGASSIVRWAVPFGPAASPTEVAVANWPHIFRNNFKKPLPITLADLYEVFQPLFGNYAGLPASIQTKYENTVTFINGQLAPAV